MNEPLDYADPRIKAPRTSALAVLSVVISVLACPFLSSVALAEARDRFGFSGRVVPEATVWVIVFAMCIAGIALIRITRSESNLKGARYAYFAFALCAIWIGLNFLLDQLLGNMRFGPMD